MEFVLDLKGCPGIEPILNAGGIGVEVVEGWVRGGWL